MSGTPGYEAPVAMHSESARPESVLVVDDETGIRDLMSRWLKAVGFSVKTASNAEDALQALRNRPAAVALCDINMPGHNGLWLADRIRHEHPDTAIIMATALTDVDPAVESVRSGVVDYLTKPFGRDRLREAVTKGVEWHRHACDSRKWRDALDREVHARHERLAKAIGSLEIVSDEMLDGMLSMLTLDDGDREAYAHAYRVAALSVGVARAMDFHESEVAVVERGALLHDFGKLAMPHALLRKPAPLTIEEQSLIRTHPAVGSALLARVPYLTAAAAVVRDAHERPDGRGFPQGSRGDTVWLGARIVTVADAFDTMTRPRVFRGALTPGEALAELDCGRGTQFDERVVDVFTRIKP